MRSLINPLWIAAVLFLGQFQRSECWTVGNLNRMQHQPPSRLFTAALSSGCIAPETTDTQLEAVQKRLDEVFGIVDSKEWNDRRQAAIDLSESDSSVALLERHERVYGELGLEAVATLLDAVGVQPNECFLDIGSGDGLIVAGAAMLFPEHVRVSRGLEIIPALHERSVMYHQKLLLLQKQNAFSCSPMEFYMGDIHDAIQDFSSDENNAEETTVLDIVQDTTLAVCFATTWSRGNAGRQLPKLAKALEALPSGSRVVVVDGVLSSDALEDCGELRLYCPDTAPYSTARLYTRRRAVTVND